MRREGERMRVTEYVLYRKRRGEEGDQKEGERAYGAQIRM